MRFRPTPPAALSEMKRLLYPGINNAAFPFMKNGHALICLKFPNFPEPVKASPIQVFR